MASKIFIAILVTVHIISCRTELKIDICESDQVVLDHVNQFNNGIVPIFLIANINENPFIGTVMDRIKKYFEIKNLSNLLIVPADTCVVTDNFLIYYRRSKGYPTIFMIKDGHLMGGNTEYHTDKDITEAYGYACNQPINQSRGNFAKLLKATIDCFGRKELTPANQSKKPRTKGGRNFQPPQVFNSMDLESTAPTSRPLSHRTAHRNQSITQDRNKIPVVRPPSHGTLVSARNPATTSSTVLAPTSTYSTGRQGDEMTGSMTSPSSQWQQPEVRYPVSGGTQFTAAGTSGNVQIQTYPIGNELQAKGFLSTMGRRRDNDRDHEADNHSRPLQSSNLDLFEHKKRKTSE